MTTTEFSLRPIATAALPAPPAPTRYAFADVLKVWLVAGVIVGHVTMSWSGIDAWVLSEPPVREPLLTLIKLAAVVGTMFAMALFFMIAGAFTPRSLAHKGLRRFLADRTVRLGTPVLFFAVVFAPIVEYVDSDNVGWHEGFPAFAVHIWRNPAPGPTWFLAVLLLFSTVYAVARTIRPARPVAPGPPDPAVLAAVAVFIVVASYPIRIAVPFGEEYSHLALGQAPSWVAGFVLGVLGAERGWFEHISDTMARRAFRLAWSAAAAVVLLVIVTASVNDGNVDALFGGRSWPSLLMLAAEALLVVAMSLWIFDAFRRHVTGEGRLMRALGRAAFATFIVHQVIAVGAVLATHFVSWPPEVEYPLAVLLAVVGSFAVGLLVVRLPGVSRIV